MNKPVDFGALQGGCVPYQKPQPWGMTPDMIQHDLMDGDERLWAPISEGIWSRPIHLLSLIHI